MFNVCVAAGKPKVVMSGVTITGKKITLKMALGNSEIPKDNGENGQRILLFVYRCRATETGELLLTKVPSLHWNWMVFKVPGSKHNPL